MHPFSGRAKAYESKKKNAYAQGGAVKDRGLTAKPVPAMRPAMKAPAVDLMAEGGPPKPRADRFNRGGPVKSKGKGNNVSVIIAMPPKGAEKEPVPVPVPTAAAPPPPPPRPPMPMGPPGGAPGAGLGGVGGRPPFKRGGRVK